MMCSHVHDFIYWGNKEFEEEVLRKLKERSEVGREGEVRRFLRFGVMEKGFKKRGRRGERGNERRLLANECGFRLVLRVLVPRLNVLLVFS